MTVNSTEWSVWQFMRQPGFILAILNFCIGLVWIAVILPLDAPDEPGHLQAIMQVRNQYILPEIHYATTNHIGEISGPPVDPETVGYVTKLLPKLPVTEQYFVVPYESFQPPLYYVAAGLVAHLFPPRPEVVLYVGRFLAVLFGAATVYFCWLTTRELAPQAHGWAVASAGVVALLPQFCFNNAHASNDSTVGLTATAAFYVWIRGLRNPDFDRRLLLASAMLGFALLAKLTAVALIPGFALVLAFRIFQVRPSVLGLANWLKRGLSMIMGATVSAVLVCGWWFLRNFFTYGEPSGTSAALRFFAAKFVKADFTLPRTARDLLRHTLESFWGRFGWNDITLPPEVYRFCNSAALFLVGLSVLAGIGVIGLWAARRRVPDVAWQAFLVFLAVALSLLAGYLRFNQKIAYMSMARYFFIMLLPGALLGTGGLYALAATRALRMAVFGIVFIALGLLNTFALVTVSRAGPAIGGVRYHTQKSTH
jgi:4-amino-4-deoxy-L-arabinose transferase-like glycosyltransferase